MSSKRARGKKISTNDGIIQSLLDGKDPSKEYSHEQLVNFCEAHDLGDCYDSTTPQLVSALRKYQLPSYSVLSRKPIKMDRRKKYYQSVDQKPHGFWMGHGNSWFGFWYGGEFPEDVYLYQVKLKTGLYTSKRRYRAGKSPSKIFVVKDESDVKYILDEYMAEVPDELRFLPNHSIGATPPGGGETMDVSTSYIDWEKFARRYIGIEIRDYDENLRNYLWYSSFDVNSTCIWDLTAVELVKRVKV